VAGDPSGGDVTPPFCGRAAGLPYIAAATNTGTFCGERDGDGNLVYCLAGDRCLSTIMNVCGKAAPGEGYLPFAGGPVACGMAWDWGPHPEIAGSCASGDLCPAGLCVSARPGCNVSAPYPTLATLTGAGTECGEGPEDGDYLFCPAAMICLDVHLSFCAPSQPGDVYVAFVGGPVSCGLAAGQSTPAAGGCAAGDLCADAAAAAGVCGVGAQAAVYPASPSRLGTFCGEGPGDGVNNFCEPDDVCADHSHRLCRAGRGGDYYLAYASAPVACGNVQYWTPQVAAGGCAANDTCADASNGLCAVASE
jgi:hypothetical protein